MLADGTPTDLVQPLLHYVSMAGERHQVHERGAAGPFRTFDVPRVQFCEELVVGDARISGLEELARREDDDKDLDEAVLQQGTAKLRRGTPEGIALTEL